MTQKTISLPEKVYNSLKKKKRNEETYSELISRLLNENEQRLPSPNISTFFGKLEEEKEGEWDEIENSIYKNRNISPKNSLDSFDE